MDLVTLSKFVGAISAPGNLLALMFVVGLVLTPTKLKHLGRWVINVDAAIIGAVFFLPVGATLLAPLENRFPQPDLPRHVDGILVLSGGESPSVFATRRTGAMLYSEGRLVEAVRLSRVFPEARIVFSGFEADVAKAAFHQLGLSPSRIAFESRARNTWENILFSKALSDPKPDETWLLITHAASMPRAIGVAREVGWSFVAWPVDYKTSANGPGASFAFTNSLESLDAAVHEWIGLVAYRLTGRSASWFPAENR
jgi:uncharacterized SAM-binding protein YcdF (DUF218 family)